MKKFISAVQSYISILTFWDKRKQPNKIPETRHFFNKMAPDLYTEWPTKDFQITRRPWWFLPKIVRFIYKHKKVTYFSYKHTESILALYKGKLIYEWYANGFNRETEFSMMSMTKTIISLILGLAIKDGYVKSIKQNVLDFYPEAKKYIKKGEGKDTLTIEHLITMTSGLKDDSEWYLADDTGLAGFLRTQLTPPGKKFRYLSVNYHILGCALQRILKRNLFEFAKERIFDPLGITSVKWNKLSDGSHQGNGGIVMTARDMLRLGYLWINNGRWENLQIVEPNYIIQQTPHSKAPHAFGSPFWNNSWFPFSFIGSFESRGHNGQFISIYPLLDLVIVRNGWPEKRKSITDKSKKLSGSAFFLPGLLSEDQLEFEKNNIIKIIIENAGGTVTKKVNIKTAFVITEDVNLQNARKAKMNHKKSASDASMFSFINKADELGVPIIDYNKLVSML